jgi:hypothetical protein
MPNTVNAGAMALVGTLFQEKADEFRDVCDSL